MVSATRPAIAKLQQIRVIGLATVVGYSCGNISRVSVPLTTSKNLDVNYNIVASRLHGRYIFGDSGPWL